MSLMKIWDREVWEGKLEISYYEKNTFMACYYYSFQKKKTICKFVIFNEDLGSGWGGLGGVKFILELLNF